LIGDDYYNNNNILLLLLWMRRSILVGLSLIMRVENLRHLSHRSAIEVDQKDHLEHRFDGMRLSEEDLGADGVWKMVESAPDKDNSLDTHSEPRSSRQIPQQYYLLPGLLSEPNRLSEDCCSDHIPASVTSLPCDLHQQQHVGPFVHQGSIRLERVFTFRRFVPSLLVPRIIARMYSKHNHIVKQSCMEHLDGAADLSKCWKSSFIQEHGNCTVWVLLKDAVQVASTPQEAANLHSNDSTIGRNFDIDAALSMDQSQSSIPEESNIQSRASISLYSSSPSIYANNFQEEEDERDWTAGRSERVKQLKIVSHGHLLDCQSIIEALNDYSSTVQEVLDEYLEHISYNTHTVCPVCLLKQYPDDLCGSISTNDEQTLMSSIHSLVYDGTHKTDNQLLEAYKQWDKKSTVQCMRNGCIVKSDFLIQLPLKLVSLLSSQGDVAYASMVAYIRETVLNNSALAPSTRFVTTSSIEMASSLVRVLQIRVKDKLQYQRFKTALFTIPNSNSSYPHQHPHQHPPEEFQMKCERLLSGSKVCIPLALKDIHLRLGDRLGSDPTADFILTSFPTKSVYERQKLQQYFLIGNSQHWLYVARYINQAVLCGELDDLSGRDDRTTSDAVLLEFIAPIKPIPFQRFTTEITFQLDRTRTAEHSTSLPLGGEFKSLPLYIDRRSHGEQGSEVISTVDDGLIDGTCSGAIDIEHPVQAWGFTANSSTPDSYWARVVLRSGRFYLVSTYSDEHPTTGGPVLHCTGEVVGIISERQYKKGTQSARYVATLR